MHPRQANLLAGAQKLSEALAPTSKEAAAPILWKYTTPEGETFYTDIRQMTIRSPWSGKSFTTRPERINPSQVKQDLGAEPALMMAAEGDARKS